MSEQECQEKHAITVEIMDVIGSLLKLTNEEFKAVIDGDSTRGESIQAELRVLREWKDVPWIGSVSTSRTMDVRRGQALG